jgi:hypothetical protein
MVLVISGFPPFYGKSIHGGGKEEKEHLKKWEKVELRDLETSGKELLWGKKEKVG